MSSPKIGTSTIRPLDHLLVVAGLRGAGKTAFLQALVAGKIGPDVLPQFPKSGKGWPQVQAAAHAEWMPSITTAGPPSVRNLALHCDLVSFHYEFGESALDVLSLARKVTVINIKPNIARLALQLGARTSRSASSLAADRIPLDEVWNDVAPPRLPPTSGAVDPAKQARYIAAMRRYVLARYGDAAWVERLYAEWDATVDRLAAGARLRRLEIEPVEFAGSGAFRWRLKSDSGEPRREKLRGKAA